MEAEFVPYEQALALKELGFDDKTFKSYDTSVVLVDGKYLLDNWYDVSTVDEVKAPLYQQAFRWFREKYKLVNYIEYYAEWNFEIFRIDDKIAEVQDDVNVDYTFKGGTYKEAELECLKKLIEILKEQK
jgi:hypothetical protein